MNLWVYGGRTGREAETHIVIQLQIKIKIRLGCRRFLGGDGYGVMWRSAEPVYGHGGRCGGVE